MKKMLALVLAAVMALSMAACGGSNSASGTDSSASTAQTGTAQGNNVTVELGPNPKLWIPPSTPPWMAATPSSLPLRVCC